MKEHMIARSLQLSDEQRDKLLKYVQEHREFPNVVEVEFAGEEPTTLPVKELSFRRVGKVSHVHFMG